MSQDPKQAVTAKQLIEGVYQELLRRTNPSMVVNVTCKYEQDAPYLFAARRRGNAITVTFGVGLNDPSFKVAVAHASKAIGDLKRDALDPNFTSAPVMMIGREVTNA